MIENILNLYNSSNYHGQKKLSVMKIIEFNSSLNSLYYKIIQKKCIANISDELRQS